MKNIILTPKQIDKLSEHELREIAKMGTLSVMQTIGEFYMNTPSREEFKHLTGEIHLSEAARKYNLAKVTIRQWISSGLLDYVGQTKNRKLLREKDIAYLAARFRALGGSQGKKVMN